MTPLSLAAALSAALNGSPTLLDAEAALDAAEASELTARGVFDPTLTVGWDRTQQSNKTYLGGFPMSSTANGNSGDLGISGELPTGTSWTFTSRLAYTNSLITTDLGAGADASEVVNWQANTGLTLRQDVLALLRPTAASVARRQAIEAEDQAVLQALEARQSALAEVAGAWWSWESAVAQREVSARALDEAAQTVRVTEVWREVGQTDDTELARVRAAELAARIALMQAEAAAQRAADALLVSLGQAPGADIVPGASWTPTPPSADLSAHLSRAREANPGLARQRIVEEAAEEAARDRRYDRLPSVSVYGQVGRSSLESDPSSALRALTSPDGFPTLAMGADLSVPLGTRAAAGRQQSADLNAERARIALADAERSLDASVRAAYRDWQTAAQSLQLAQARLDVAAQTEAGEQARLDAGSRRTDQLLSARADRQDAEVELLAAERELLSAQLELARLEGDVEGWLLP